MPDRPQGPQSGRAATKPINDLAVVTAGGLGCATEKDAIFHFHEIYNDLGYFFSLVIGKWIDFHLVLIHIYCNIYIAGFTELSTFISETFIFIGSFVPKQMIKIHIYSFHWGIIL